MIHIFEHSGVLLRVDYSVALDLITDFNDVRVMDANYRPVGPDLSRLLDNMLLMVEGDEPEPTCQTMLSAILEDMKVKQ